MSVTDSKARVKEYFEANKTTVVGVADRIDICPLANFYKDVFGWETVFIISELEHYEGAKVYRKPLKNWQRKFTKAIDKTYGHGTKVTGLDALRVLEEV